MLITDQIRTNIKEKWEDVKLAIFSETNELESVSELDGP